MRVAISGTNSAIGRAVVRECSNRGIDVVLLNRTGAPEKFDLTAPIRLNLVKIDAFIHLAWDWEESYPESHRRNIENILPFLDSFEKNKVKFVLLSTESAAGPAKSNYGKLKNELEGEFANRGGTSVRAGLLWGSYLSGIVSTICRLSAIPVLCAHLRPDPSFHVSHEEEIARELVSQAVTPNASNSIVSLKSKDQIKLSEISHAFQGTQSKFFHLAFRVEDLIAIFTLIMKSNLNLPFRVDSLRSLLGQQSFDYDPGILEKNTDSSTLDFLQWISASRI